MKILHVLYSGLGGHGNVFFSLVNADVSSAFTYEALFNGVEDVRQEYIDRCNAKNISWNFVKKKQGMDLGFYKNLVSTIKKSNPDIIFLHGSTQVLWAKLAAITKKGKCKIVVRETQANHLKTKQDWFWLAAALLLSNKIVFLTEAYRNEIKKKLSWLYAGRKVAVISNGISLQQFAPAIKKQSDVICIGMQSRIVKIKDHATLLRAFALLLQDKELANKTILLKIAGDGDCKQGLQQLATALGIASQVEFTGMLPEDQLVSFLSNLDIYVHASFGETMSTAIMQAMACQKIIIASDVPGINNMIQQDVTGILVPVENIALLYQKIKAIITDPFRAIELARNGNAYAVANFSNEVMFANYKHLFLTQ